MSSTQRLTPSCPKLQQVRLALELCGAHRRGLGRWRIEFERPDSIAWPKGTLRVVFDADEVARHHSLEAWQLRLLGQRHLPCPSSVLDRHIEQHQCSIERDIRHRVVPSRAFQPRFQCGGIETAALVRGLAPSCSMACYRPRVFPGSPRIPRSVASHHSLLSGPRSATAPLAAPPRLLRRRLRCPPWKRQRSKPT